MPGTSVYPGALDDFIDPVGGMPGAIEWLQRLSNAVEKIEAELGLNPRGTYADAAARLAALGGSAPVLPLRWTGTTVPLRNTVTTDATRMVWWIGPQWPQIGSGYLIEGVDVASRIVT